MNAGGPRPRDADTMRSRGMAALVGAAVLWSLNGPLIKLLSSSASGEPGVPAATIACYRSLLGGLLFLPLAWRGFSQLRGTHPGWPAFSVAAFTVMTLFFVMATTSGSAANAIVLQYTSPLWVFLLAPALLGERGGRGEGGILLLAMAGVAVIFAGHATSELTPLLLGLASGLGYGLLTIALRGLRAVDPLAVVALNFLGSGVLLLPAAAAWGELWITPRQWLLVLVFSVVQFALPYVIFTWALRHVEARRAALIVLLEALLNPVMTWLLVGERVPTATLIGGPILLLSVGWWIARSGRPAAARPTPNSPAR